MQLRSMSFVMTIVLFTFAAFASPEKSAPAPDSADDRIIQTMSAGAHRGLTLYDCADGDVHDDGSAENEYGWPDTVTDGRYVEKFTPASYPFKYSDVCVCISQTEKFVGFYSVVMYDDNGPGGSPGDEIFRLVTSTDFFDVFHSMPIEAHCPAIESGSVYFGVQWNADSALHTFVCADESATTIVDMMDFLDARANLGMCLSMPCLGDVDNDGDVDDNDLQLILLNLGPCQFPRAATVQSGHGKGRR